METRCNLDIRQINEKLLELEGALASTKELNRIELYQDIREIRASLRHTMADISEMVSGERVYLAKIL